MDTPAPSPILIGWKEYLDFPEWGIRKLRVKIDTGARTSALDVAGYEIIDNLEGKSIARLRLALNRRHPASIKVVEAPVKRITVVRNSGGASERRPVIEAAIQVGPVQRRIEVTLTHRSGLRCRMLLGRRALADCFIVDAGRAYLLRS